MLKTKLQNNEIMSKQYRSQLKKFQIAKTVNNLSSEVILDWVQVCYVATPLQYSCLENPMDGGTWWAAIHGVAKSRTRLSDFTFTFHFPALEKEMATHSSVLAWRIPETGEPGGLPSMGSHRVGHNWSNLAAAAACYVALVMSDSLRTYGL